MHAGKFYELYADDAQIGHDVLNWKLTVTGTQIPVWNVEYGSGLSRSHDEAMATPSNVHTVSIVSSVNQRRFACRRRPLPAGGLPRERR